MGIQGAAIATVLAQMMALSWQLKIFSNKNELIHLRKGTFRLQPKIVSNTLAIGLSPFLMNLCACFVVILINKGLQKHGGDLAIGAYGIANRVVFFFVMIVMGLNQGMQPIAGYNYGIYRYQHDLKKYPDRLILGSETFCNDAYRFRELAKKEPRLVGDFVWAGMDYMGEVGVGSWEYKEYAPQFEGLGWMLAGSGRIDLTGKPLGEALYTRVALEKEVGPYIAVRPVNHEGEKHSPSAWKMTNAMDSWSWRGCEGRMAFAPPK